MNIPLDGSLYGWLDGDSVSTLLVIYAEPAWSALSREDVPESAWPPGLEMKLSEFVEAGFWDYVAEGRVVNLASLVAGSPGTVFWVMTPSALSYSCAAVAADVTSPEGWVLPAGAYVWCRSLRDGESAPALPELLADPSRVDLAPGLRRLIQKAGAGR